MEDDMTGKSVVITGATSGIGLAAARTLARHGANIIGIGRDARRCTEAAEAVQAVAEGSQVRYLVADLARLAEVRRLAPEIHGVLGEWGAGHLDALVNNAGVISPKYVLTEDGLELTLAVTHFAHFLLTDLLQPELRAAPFGRVITVSSASHYGTWLNLRRLNRPLVYFVLSAYKTAKLCNVLFTHEFNRRHAETAMRAFALDPGLVNTKIGQKHGPDLYSAFWELRRQGGASPDIPADGILFLASHPELQQASEYYWRYNRRPRRPSLASQNKRTAAELWQLSEKLCGVDGASEVKIGG